MLIIISYACPGANTTTKKILKFDIISGSIGIQSYSVDQHYTTSGRSLGFVGLFPVD